MVKVNAFPTLTASFSTHFFSNLFTAFEAIFLTNVGTFSPANRISTFVSAFFLNIPIQETKDPPDWIIWSLLCFIPVDILLVNVFIIEVFYVIVRNNLFSNSSFRQCILVILNVFPVLFFAVILICLLMCLVV